MNIDKWIRSRKELQDLRKFLDLSVDWHNADCCGLEVVLYENAFDNAHCDESEAYLVLSYYNDDEPENEPTKYAINAALLFAYACGWDERKLGKRARDRQEFPVDHTRLAGDAVILDDYLEK